MDARHRAAERAYRADPCARTLAALRRFTGFYALMSPATLRERRDGVAGWYRMGRHELLTLEHLDYLARTPRPDVVRCEGRPEFVIRWRWSDGRVRRRPRPPSLIPKIRQMGGLPLRFSESGYYVNFIPWFEAATTLTTTAPGPLFPAETPKQRKAREAAEKSRGAFRHAGRGGRHRGRTTPRR